MMPFCLPCQLQKNSAAEATKLQLRGFMTAVICWICFWIEEKEKFCWFLFSLPFALSLSLSLSLSLYLSLSLSLSQLPSLWHEFSLFFSGCHQSDNPVATTAATDSSFFKDLDNVDNDLERCLKLALFLSFSYSLSPNLCRRRRRRRRQRRHHRHCRRRHHHRHRRCD